VSIAHQLEQIGIGSARDFGRAREVLVLFLTQPTKAVGDVDADSWCVAEVRTATVIHRTRVQQDRSPGHRRSDGIGGFNSEFVRSLVGPRNDTGSAVLLRKVSKAVCFPSTFGMVAVPAKCAHPVIVAHFRVLVHSVAHGATDDTTTPAKPRQSARSRRRLRSVRANDRRLSTSGSVASTIRQPCSTSSRRRNASRS
jgi:hypothetical protein